MAVAEELIALLGYKVQGQAEVAKWKRGIDESEQKAKGLSSRLGGLGSAAGVAGAAMVGMAVKGLTNFAAFERQMSRIGITAGATVSETVGAARQVQDLANQFAMPLDEARNGLDTLVSSGMSLRDAMTFLPSVLLTAQAAGAATEDMANTAQKTASSLGLQADQMQKAFDIMVAGGKAGQFELKDMAQFIPTLASQFSTLGYKGEEGLKRLIAILQTLRTRTGTAGEAATQATNIFSKIFSEQTAKSFKEFGINFSKEMAKAKAQGKDVLTAFTDLTEKALKGDMTKLPKLFQDLQMQQGVTTLVQARAEMKGFLEDVNSAQVEGSGLRDFQRIVGDTESSIQKMSNSYDQMLKAIGGFVAEPATKAMNAVTSGIDKTRLADEARGRRGDSALYRMFAPYWENPDDVIAQDKKSKQRSSIDYLRQPAPQAPAIPSILKSRPAATPTDRVGQAFSSFPAAAGEVNAVANLDISKFIAPANIAKATMADLSTSFTAHIDLDISSLEAKADRAAKLILGLRTMGAAAMSGGGSPTPARVVGAGAAP